MNPSWQLQSADGPEYFACSPSPRLLLAFFTRRGGVSRGDYESLNTSFEVGDDNRNVEENLARARRALRLPAILTVKQTHSDTVLPIADEPIPPETLEGDACFTDRAGIAHCGWRGTVARLAEKTARQMSRRFSVPLPDLRFALGPCICPNCYEVGDDVRQEFSKSFANADQFFTPDTTIVPVGQSPIAIRHSPIAKYRLDIRAANRWLLKELGLTESESLELCTLETRNLCYSARRSKTTGRNLAVIALRSAPPV
jgi:copper oxidase (laccase) domain-containing protein